MQKILVDTGPLVALFDRSDQYHLKALGFIKSYKGILVSSWPVMTEVLHLLDFSIETQLDFLDWVQKGGLLIEEVDVTELPKIRSYIKKYSDRPMDLADATLLIIADKLRINSVLTLDSDFLFYKLTNGKTLKNILGS